MDWLTFIAEVMKALAWPAAIVFIVLLLRRPLSALIPLLKSFKYKDFMLEFFERKMKELKADVVKALPEPVPEKSPLKIPDHIIQLAEISPRKVVMETWLKLEMAAREAVKCQQVDLSPHDITSAVNLVKALEAAGVLDSTLLNLFQNLRALRDNAAHAPDFALDSGSVIEYADFASRLEEHLRKS